MKSLSLITILALTMAGTSLAAAAQQDTSTAPSGAQQAPATQQPDAAQSGSTTTTTTTTTQQTTSDQSQATPATSGSSQASPMSGTIAKAGGKYVLQTSNGTYQLDNQDKASQFEGKQVAVNGSMDQSTSMIHVIDISPAQ